MYQLVDGHNFDISLSLFLSTLLLFSKKTQNSATVFEVRHGKLRKETTQGKVLQTISKFFGGKLQCIFFYRRNGEHFGGEGKIIGEGPFFGFCKIVKKKKS